MTEDNIHQEISLKCLSLMNEWWDQHFYSFIDIENLSRQDPETHYGRKKIK